MKKIKLGPIFGEAILESKRTSTLVDQELLSASQTWGAEFTEVKKRPISTWRLIPLYLFFILSFLFLVARAFSLQVIQGANFLSQSEGNHVRIITTHADRGAILDRNGKVIAQSEPGFRVAVDKQVFPLEKAEVVNLLASLLKEAPADLKKNIQASDVNDIVTVKDNIDHASAIALDAQSDKLPGVDVEISPIREYLLGPVLAPILGYTSEVSKEDLASNGTAYLPGDKVGRVGAEAAFEARLRGANGYELVKVNAEGKRQGSFLKTDPVAGNDVTLSIDADLSKVIYDALTDAVKTSGGVSGAAVAMNPATGEILSLVSYPSYDDNLFSKGLSQSDFNSLFGDPARPLLNRAIGSAFPPGSTFKLIMSAAGLQSGTITKDTKFVDNGYINFGGIIYNNWLWIEQHRTDGAINVVRALARSNDIFFYNLGEQLGVDQIDKYAHLFGLGETTGIEIPGEIAGLVPSPQWKEETFGQPWYPGETLNISIGQGDTLVTPIQLATVTAAIANGGKLIQPTLSPTDSPNVVRADFLSKETLQTIQEGMIEDQKGDGNVGFLFNNFPIPTAGKTGSAESGGEKPHSWYTVYAPVNNPKIVLTMVVEKGGHGALVTAPEAKKILQWYFANRK